MGYLRWLFIFLMLSAVIFVGVHLSEEKDFLVLLERSEPLWLLAGVLFQAGTYLSEALNWKLGLELRRESVPLKTLLKLSVCQIFINQTIPSVSVSGALFVSRSLTHRGASQKNVSFSLGLAVFSFFLAYPLMILTGLFYLRAKEIIPPEVLLTFVIIFVALAGAMIFFGKRFQSFLVKLFTIVSRRIKFLESPLKLIKEMEFSDLPLRAVMRATGYQIAVFIFDCLTLWAMLRALGIHLGAFPVFISYMAAYIARSLGLFPGGIGIFEAAGIATLHQNGVTVAGAMAATLLYRGFSYWLPMIPGLFLVRKEFRSDEKLKEIQISKGADSHQPASIVPGRR